MVGGVETLLDAEQGHGDQGHGEAGAAARTVTVSPGGETIDAANVIIATGGVTKLAAQLPIDGDRIITSREALELQAGAKIDRHRRRRRPIGAEFGYLYRSYGAEVTIVELLERALPNEDEDVSRASSSAPSRSRASRSTRRRRSQSIKTGKTSVKVTIAAGDRTEGIEAERCLVGVGFGPNSEGSGSKRPALQLERGWVNVDEYCAARTCRTCLRHRRRHRQAAAGHVASHQGVTAVEKIAGRNPPPLDYVTDAARRRTASRRSPAWG